MSAAERKLTTLTSRPSSRKYPFLSAMKIGASLVLLVAPTVMACAAAMPDEAKKAYVRIANRVRLFKRVPPVHSFSVSIKKQRHGIAHRRGDEPRHDPLPFGED